MLLSEAPRTQDAKRAGPPYQHMYILLFRLLALFGTATYRCEPHRTLFVRTSCKSTHALSHVICGHTETSIGDNGFTKSKMCFNQPIERPQAATSIQKVRLSRIKVYHTFITY